MAPIHHASKHDLAPGSPSRLRTAPKRQAWRSQTRSGAEAAEMPFAPAAKRAWRRGYPRVNASGRSKFPAPTEWGQYWGVVPTAIEFCVGVGGALDPAAGWLPPVVCSEDAGENRRVMGALRHHQDVRLAHP